MRTMHLVMIAMALISPRPTLAQSDATVSPDSAAPAPKKKGGLFGKMKNLSKNKVVNQVAKAALCTAVPGGQVIAGAMEAKETKNVATGATAAVTGGSSACMPGMSGMATGAGGSGVAGAVAGAGLSAAAMQQRAQEPVAPGSGMSDEQMKEMVAQYRRMGVSPTQIKAMQEQMRALPQPTPGADPATLASAGSASRGYAPADGGARGVAMSREKHRLVVRDLPWMPGSEGVVEGASAVFGLAMRDLAGAMRTSSARYRVEVRVEDQGGKQENRALARKRSEAVIAALAAEGIPAERLAPADGGGDKDPRTVASETK